MTRATLASGLSGGVNVWVVSVGGKGSVTSGSTHRVMLSMTPWLRRNETSDSGEEVDFTDSSEWMRVAPS